MTTQIAADLARIRWWAWRGDSDVSKPVPPRVSAALMEPAELDGREALVS